MNGTYRLGEAADAGNCVLRFFHAPVHRTIRQGKCRTRSGIAENLPLVAGLQ